MVDTRLFTVLSVVVLSGFLALTGFHALQEGRRTRDFIRDHEMSSLGLALTANLDRTAARYLHVGEELLRDGFLRDWILAGEQDEQALRSFLESVRSRFDMMDASVVSDRTETYYGTDGRTLVLDPDNQERDGWYYLYRDSLVETNIDSWYYPETGKIGMWVNVPIQDEDGTFLGVTGGGFMSDEFTETLHAFGQLPGVNVYLARKDGQIVYAADAALLKSGAAIDDLWGVTLTGRFAQDHSERPSLVLEPGGLAGPIIWASYCDDWSTYLVLEKTGEIVSARTRATMINSAMAGGILTVSFSGIVVAIVLAAHKRIQQQARRLEELAGTDALTGLNNRVRFNEIVERELARIGRTGEQSCLVLLDLDYFKSVNDTHGHPAGDAVLVRIAEVVRAHLRETDHVARFGGEEFTLLLPGTDLYGAQNVAEKLRFAIARCDFVGTAGSFSITASFGIAPLLGDGAATLDDAYNEADRALYRAKRSGRNRVEIAVAPAEQMIN